jgi:hypothetical protein
MGSQAYLPCLTILPRVTTTQDHRPSVHPPIRSATHAAVKRRRQQPCATHAKYVDMHAARCLETHPVSAPVISQTIRPLISTHQIPHIIISGLKYDTYKFDIGPKVNEGHPLQFTSPRYACESRNYSFEKWAARVNFTDLEYWLSWVESRYRTHPHFFIRFGCIS